MTTVRRSLGAVLAAGLASFSSGLGAEDAPQRFTDDQIVAQYQALAAAGGLERAARTPALPKDAPLPEFLEALAWYAAGMPREAGSLTLVQLDEYLSGAVRGYLELVRDKAERGRDNDYARTRTWKLVQKLTLLRAELAQPARAGRYAYRPMARAAAPGGDPWEQQHTLRSAEEFAAKVCGPSHDRPVLVKFGNTNCTQCMLFELIGSVKAFAAHPAHAGLDVYKVWWGYRPDASFTGRVADPERLDALVKSEGVKSSPTFVVYRNGRRYPCADAFPDDSGRDARLEACVAQATGEAPAASACVAGADAAGGTAAASARP